jgi:hypothetical protein
MDETKFRKALDEIAAGLLNVKYTGDASDIGNEFGILIGKFLDGEMGWDKDAVVSGIKHGISLTDGTHG